MGTSSRGERHDRNPLTKPGVTGFEQDYNEEPPPTQDLNPDVVDDPDSLPEPQTPAPARAARAARTPATDTTRGKAKKGRRT
jgi:hypothetical protein